MAEIKMFPYNILAEGATTVTGDPDTGYPEARLYDFSIDFYWKDTASDTYVFQVNQSTTLPIDLLVVEIHNFSGLTIHWEYSDNGSDWTAAVSSWVAGADQIIKTLDVALSHKYWRVRVISAVNPQCTEIYMSGGYSFRVDFQTEPESGDLDNVIWQESLGGLERSVKLGEERKTRNYRLILDNTAVLSFRTATAYMNNYSRPFYFGDHESNYWLARFKSISKERHMADEAGLVSRNIEILEVL